MKKIKIKKLILNNFQGLKSKTILFSGLTTDIFGNNGTGKTTANNAFRWLLFDKDSEDRSEFNIKTLDKNNEPIHGIEHSVIGEFEIDSKKISLKKIYLEKWETKRGERDKIFTGHTTKYYINEVPLSAGNYKKEIDSIIDEQLFKLLTDPLYFSMKLSWQDRREILTKLEGDIKTSEILESTNELDELSKPLLYHSIDTLKAIIKDKIKKLNDEIKILPSRIDEANLTIKDLNFTGLKKDLKIKESSLAVIEKQLNEQTLDDPEIDKLKTDLSKIRAKKDEIYDNVNQRREEQLRKIRSNIVKKESETRDILNKFSLMKSDVVDFEKEINGIDSQLGQLREDWHRENDAEFEVNDDFVCPTCERPLEKEDIEAKTNKMLENFNNEKAKNLELINERGHNLSLQKEYDLEKIESLKSDINELESLDLESELSVLKSELSHIIDSELEMPAEYRDLDKEESVILKKIKSGRSEDERLKRNNLILDKKQLQLKIDVLKNEIRQEQINKTQKERIKELSLKEKKYAQEIADLEKRQFLCERFTTIKSELLESKINSRFVLVKFKLFELQINGGLKETCEVLIEGVPFSNANHGSRVNAGIDIINTLAEHYEINAPIIFDNAESVTRLIHTDAQLIRLIVSEMDKELRIENK